MPQGSILGPLLFIIYINDLSTYLTECKVSLSADDTAMYAASSSYIDMILSLRIDMATVAEWLKLNKLTLNVDKAKLMIFCSQQKLNTIQDVDICIEGRTIERVNTFKYLGMTLDQCLTFNDHIDKLYSKCCAKLGAIRKARACMGQNLALRLYKSLILPHLDMGDIIYDVATQESKSKLQLLQNAACRVILCRGKLDSTHKMHEDLKLSKLSDRRDMHLSQLTHKNVHDEGCLSRLIHRTAVGRGHRTRRCNEFNLTVPRTKTMKGRCAYSYRGPVNWNRLKVDLKAIIKYETFKRSIAKEVFPPFDNHPT